MEENIAYDALINTLHAKLIPLFAVEFQHECESSEESNKDPIFRELFAIYLVLSKIYEVCELYESHLNANCCPSDLTFRKQTACIQIKQAVLGKDNLPSLPSLREIMIGTTALFNVKKLVEKNEDLFSEQQDWWGIRLVGDILKVIGRFMGLVEQPFSLFKSHGSRFCKSVNSELAKVPKLG